MTFDDFEYQYSTTEERLEQEKWNQLRKIQDEYLSQFNFNEGDRIEYDGEFIGTFDSLEWDGEDVTLYYFSNEYPQKCTSMDSVNPDLLTLHEAA